MFSMGRDTEIWGNDADQFRPERWLEMKEVPTSYEYPVFNAGPRECLGKRLAMVEMKACLATVLPHVSFQLAVPSEEIKPDNQLTIGMGCGLPCYVKPLASHDRLGSAASTTVQSESESTESDFPPTEDEGCAHR